MHLQTGALEEGVHIPAVGYREANLLAGRSGDLHHLVEGLHVFLGEVLLVVEHEVAVGSGGRVGIEHAVLGSGLHDGGISAAVGSGDFLGVDHDLLERAGSVQIVELVIREGEHVGSSLGVSQHGGLAVAFGDDVHVDGVIVVGMSGLVSVDDAVNPLDIRVVADPHLEGHVFGQRAGADHRQRQRQGQNHCQELFH